MHNRCIVNKMFKMWETHADRNFMLELYPQISDYITKTKKYNLLDIGATTFNY